MLEEDLINQTTLQIIERLIPIRLNPNRIIIPIGNNRVIVVSNNLLYIFDIDGRLIRMTNLT